jgi:uncharacterized repeat protein (TIGR03847 family)
MTVFDIELDEPFHLTVGYTGQPGGRTFFLQAEDASGRVTLAIEKAQAEGIAELLTQVLARLGERPVTDWDQAAMDLRPPLDPRWRVGSIAIGYEGEDERFVLEVGEFVPEDDRVGRSARIVFDLDQARRLAAHAADVIGQGRPRCHLCARPTEADGSHVCPATNGHGRLTV